MKKPNILLIFTDQLRADALGCTGGWVKTPNIDRIASEGIRFENCVTNSPVCIPARVSLATGLYPHNTGIWHNFQYDMPADTDTWMQVVKEAGYRTSLFGKTHLHRHRGDLRDRDDLMHAYGLDDIDEIGGPRASACVLSNMTEKWRDKGLWQAYQDDYEERFSNKPHVVRSSTLPLEHYADVYVGQEAKKYLEKYDRKDPWCCWVSFGGPHEPWDSPEPYASMHKPEDMPKAVRSEKDPVDRPKGQLDNVFKGMSAPPDLNDDEIASMRVDYAGNVALIDSQIGEILKTVEDRGELENTVIIFSSDHGEMNGDHGLIYKENFYNGAVKVPLILRTPRTLKSSIAGSVSNANVELMDIGPTLVEFAGGEIKYQQFARSLVPFISDPETTVRDFVISELTGEIMIMTDKYKMVINSEGIPYLLYDLEKDPDESNNIVMNDSVKNVVLDLRLKIQEHLVRTQKTLHG